MPRSSQCMFPIGVCACPKGISRGGQPFAPPPLTAQSEGSQLVAVMSTIRRVQTGIAVIVASERIRFGPMHWRWQVTRWRLLQSVLVQQRRPYGEDAAPLTPCSFRLLAVFCFVFSLSAVSVSRACSFSTRSPVSALFIFSLTAVCRSLMAVGR